MTNPFLFLGRKRNVDLAVPTGTRSALAWSVPSRESTGAVSSEDESMFGLFKSKPKPVDSLPSAEAEPGRYKGRPLLILIENYVLACIGELPPDSNIAAVVQKAFGGGDDWMQTLREKLDMNAAIDESIRAMWVKNQAIAEQNKMQLHPVQFAKMVADRNFAQLLKLP